ncbi:MAG: haloacid dehalogenase [Candidatus Helarchaeota archaeon]
MLFELFKIIREELDVKDEIREKILEKTRKLIRKSSETIKEIHRGGIAQAETYLNDAFRLLEEINEFKSSYPSLFYSGSVVTAHQEFVEARLLFAIVKKEDLNGITPSSLNMKALPYLLGMADLCGELRRLILDNMKKDNYEAAEGYLDWMTYIHENLMTLDYPNGLIPGLRRKIDIARSLIEKTRGDLITSQKMFELSKKL